ncbi:helix-turn-helix domain-containing protein [Rouxiella badensis]|uniref:IclR family transcriptional regulator domain-containing protein n=1 Tax=Rouxiella badensis TaxID=1646377 RepID=UPI001D13B1FF|nr:IclR family transcriptional regulator C-terminal domain-containing protein [Rouxiella badensis]MCC3701917.1 helix-turn-helix domain-containing protein [Rouxiella badensis]
MKEPYRISEAELLRVQEVSELANVRYKGDPDFMASLTRGLVVLQAFSPEFFAMSVPQLSQMTGLHRAVVRRCLYTLSALGFVYSPDNRNYHLLPRVLTIGHAYLNSSELARQAQYSLDYLSKQLGESCSVATLDGDNILYIARASMKRIMKIDLGRGSRLPAYATSMGMVLLSELSEEELGSYFSRVKLEPLTEFTITDEQRLRKELKKVKAQGFAINDQQLELGLRSMAVPMYSRKEGVVAAMNVGTHASQMSVADLQEKFLPRLQRAAMELALLI